MRRTYIPPSPCTSLSVFRVFIPCVWWLTDDDDLTKQLSDDVYARGVGNGVSAAEASGKGVRALALGYEHPYPARPHRRESAGRIGPQARQAVDAAPHERRRETDWAVNRPERCVLSSLCGHDELTLTDFVLAIVVSVCFLLNSVDFQAYVRCARLGL